MVSKESKSVSGGETPIKKSDTPIREEVNNPFSNKSPISDDVSLDSKPP